MSFLLTCVNQRKQRSRFFYYEAGTNVRFEMVSPYKNDNSGNLIYTPKQLDMRRKSEILKYTVPNNGNIQKNKYSQLANQKKKTSGCPTTNKPVPTSSSDVPGPVIMLQEDSTVPLYKYYPIESQFRFQNIKYDDYKRFYDVFPVKNVSTDVENVNAHEHVGDIVILSPNTNTLLFDLVFPVTVEFAGVFQTPSTWANPPTTNENQAVATVNLGIYEATLGIFYSDTLVERITLPFRSTTNNATDIANTTVTSSIIFDRTGSESTNGFVQAKIYLGSLQFKSIRLATISQYVYTFELNVKLSYSEYDSISDSAVRSNTEGSIITNSGERNLTSVSYNSIINVEDNTGLTDNVTVESFNNPDSSQEVQPVTNVIYTPISFTNQ